MMRKLIVLLLLCCGSYCNVHAQRHLADSLGRLLQTAKEDTTRVMLLSQLSTAYVYSKPDTTLLLAREGLELARKINFKPGEARCLSSVGAFFTTTGNYPAALEAYLSALKITEETKDERRLSVALSNLSEVYFNIGDVKRSIDYAHKAIVIYQLLKDSNHLTTIYANLGDTYEKHNQLDSAMFYTKLGYALALKFHKQSSIGIGLGNLANVYRKSGKADSAMLYYRKSIRISKNENNEEGLCESYLGMAKIFLQQHHEDSGVYYAKLSYTIARQSGFTDKLLDVSTFLAQYYKSAGNIDSAYAYQAATIAAKDSLFGQQKTNQIQSMTYEEAARERQIEDAKAQERIKAKQNALIGGVVALLVVAFLLVRNNRQRRKANALLQQQKDEIDSKARELAVQKDILEQSYNNVEQLGEIGRKITASLSVEKIIGTVYDNVNVLMDAAVFGIGIYNDTLRRIEFPATYEDGEGLPFYYSSVDDENRFAVRCFKTGQEIIMGNLDEEHKLYIQEVATPHEGKQPVSLIYLPLIVKEKKSGVITVQSFQQNAYSEYHLFMLRNIATYTAIAIENAESFETLNETVSTLRSTQSQLIHAEKMASLGELSAGIAHEIQNPLNFVNNFSELNKELLIELNGEIDKGNYEAAKAIAIDVTGNEEKISHHGKRADAIVKGMLLHSRKSEGTKEPTDINALCDEYLRLSYHGLRTKNKHFNAVFKTGFDESLGKINIVPQDIGRVLLNLFNNAFYAVNEKKVPGIGYQPTVSVSTKKTGNSVTISVSDNGNGIPQNIIDKIFQPFFTTKPTGQGTGLGLSLAYDIITKEHNGTIKVESEEGKGSKLIIQLPITA